MAKRDASGKTIRVMYLAEIGGLLPPDATREGAGRKLRSTPLPWLRFRTPADTSPAGTRYAMRRRAIKGMKDGLAILGIYDELFGTYGGDRIAPIRGYLLNHHLLQASTSEIAVEVLCLDTALVERAVAAMLDVGLLVWREMDLDDLKAAIARDQTMAPTDDPPDDRLPEVDPPEAPRGRARARAHGVPKVKRARKRARNGTTAAKVAAAEARKAAETGGETPAGNLLAGCRHSASTVLAQCPQVAGQKGTYKRRETLDVKPETGDEPRATPASAAPSPSSARGSGRPEDPKQETAKAAPPPPDETPPAGGQTPDAGPPDGSHADVRVTGDAETGYELTLTDDAQVSDVDTAAETTAEAEAAQPTEADRGAGHAGADMSWHCESIAAQVVDRLYPTRADLVDQGRQCRDGPRDADEFRRTELASVGSVLAAALRGMGQVDAVRLIEWCLQRADESHRKKCKWTRGCWWVWRLGKHVEVKSSRKRALGAT